MKVIRLETERLIIKSFEETDDKALFDFRIRNAEFFKEWSPKYSEDHLEYSSHRKNIESIKEQVSSESMVQLFIFKKDESQKIIGSIGFSNIIRGPFQSCFLGYKIDESEIGNGYATESIKEAVDYIFNQLKLHRIEANIIPRNKASIRVVEKLGFTSEGLARKYLEVNGVWEDHLHYVILNENIE